jgi:membrane protein DedA with SNARE-associated domain
LPLGLFVLAGSFLEEIISPIPSFVVFIPAGAAAQVQHVGWWYLIPLGFVGAAGRLVASSILYVVADKAEHWLFGKGRRFFGVTHKQLQSYGRRFSGRPRDLLVLFLLNAVPVLPTSMLSLTCGFIKIPYRTFVVATYFGSAVNATIYMSVGYAGVHAIAKLQHVQAAFQIVFVAAVVGIVGWFLYYYRQKKRDR